MTKSNMMKSVMVLLIALAMIPTGAADYTPLVPMEEFVSQDGSEWRPLDCW